MSRHPLITRALQSSPMRRAVRWSAAASTFAALTAFARPGSAQINVGISFCEPTIPTPCDPGSCSKLKTGYQGPGFMNSASERSLSVMLAYWVAPFADKQAAIGQTERIEICKAKSLTEVECPGTQGWVVFDKSNPSTSIDPNTVAQGFQAAHATVERKCRSIGPIQLRPKRI